MKRLAILFIVLIYGCSDPLTEFDFQTNNFKNITDEFTEGVKKELLGQRSFILETLSKANFSESIPEYLGEVESSRTIVFNTKSGTIVSTTPITSNNITTGIIIGTYNGEHYKFKLIEREMIKFYYKR